MQAAARNVLDNAVNASEPGSSIEISAKATEVDGRSRCGTKAAESRILSLSACLSRL